ncbi:hypothetical protein F0562_024342 [Nyssa sinensis]|uniref:Uncharacterized protein n=1 Tax=Nyssa sinensis TaxID=561372 RepID=A0A5J5BDH4_9ASTE|nr:hypothetical protein F0562_024342 [Nyssa sinensis]
MEVRIVRSSLTTGRSATGFEMQSTSTISQVFSSFSSLDSNVSLATPSLHLHSHETPKPSISHLCISSFKTLNSQISCLAVHNNTLYAASINEINVFDLTNYALIDTFSCNDSTSGLIKSIAFCGQKIFTAHQDRKIRVWQVTVTGSSKRHRLVSTLPTVKDRLRRCISPKNYVQVRRHKKQLWIEHADAISDLAVNQGLMYSVSWDKSLKIWRMSDLRCLESVRAHEDAVNAVAVSVAGTVYTASADGMIKVWERTDGERRHALMSTLDKHKSTVNALALSDDGSLLFSGGVDRLILVWEKVDSPDHMFVRWSLKGHKAAVLCLIYVDELLVSGSSDRTVRVWQRVVEGGYCCLTVLEGHERPVKSLVAVLGGVSGSFSVCSGSLDGDNGIKDDAIEILLA